MKIYYSPTKLADLKMEYTADGIAVVKESWLDDTVVPDETEALTKLQYYGAFRELYEPHEKQMELVAHARIFGDFVCNWLPKLVLPGKEVNAELEREFRSYAQTWLQETAFLSDPVKKFMHPSHLKIIGMGKDIIPLILKEVERMSGHWFIALQAISPVNPVKPKDEMNLELLTHAWLDWGKKEGLI